MTTTQVVPAGHAAPVAQSERIDSLDVLRGFALLGILLMNIQMFGIPFAAYFNPTAYGDFTGANYWVWFAGRMFADQKFMTIFSMLFGAGVIVFTARAEERGDSPAALHYRRAFWLLVIGLAHAYLLWAGDILVSYALCAMLVYPARKLSPKALIITGLLVVSVASALMLMAAVSMPMWPPEDVAELRAGVRPPAEEIAKEIAAYRGSWGEQQPYRAKTAMEMHFMVFWLWALWRAGGLMLIGMAFYKWGIFSAVKSTAFYARMVIAGLLMLDLLPLSVLQRFDPIRYLSRLFRPLGSRLSSPTISSKFTLGLMLGFLPCGLIYAALFKAMAAGTALAGSMAMMVFGMGTVGALFALGVFSSAFSLKLARLNANGWGTRLTAISVALLGAILVWRGLMPMLNATQAANCHH